MLRPCLGTPANRCGKLSSRSRCTDCQRIWERNRPQRPTNLTRTWAEQQRRKAAVDAHIQQHGYVCPGWDRPPHPVHPPNILTADHVSPVARGGAGDGPLHVLCRVCNGAKAARSAGPGNDHYQI